MRSKLFVLPLFALTAATMALPAHARAAEDTAEATVAEAEAATGAMVESWTIVQNATKSPEHTTLTQAITAAVAPAAADAIVEPPAAEPKN